MHRPSDDPLVQKHLAFSGAFVPLILLGAALASAGVALFSRHHVAAALTSWFVLQSLLFFELRYHIGQKLSDAEKQQLSVDKLPQFFGSTLVLWLLLTASFGLGYQSTVQIPSGEQNTIAIAALALFLVLSVAILRYFQNASSETLPARRHVAAWCRASVWMSATALISALIFAAGAVESQKAVIQTMMFLSLLPVLEWLVRTLVKDEGHVFLIGDVRAINLFFSRLNPIQSIFGQLDRSFGVDIRSTWALSYVRRALVPLTVVLAILGWLSTSLVTIDTVQVGLHERFGAPVSTQALGPGLHFKAPWPIDRVHRIDTSRIRTMPLGFSGPKTGASLLWTKQHAAEEYYLLLGDGRDLVTINALLQYSVQDPWTWHYKTQNPETMLRVAAEQVLLNKTVSRSLDGVLSENLSVLARQIETEIRLRVRDYEIGAEIVGLSLQGLHPPVRVAEDYQAVISAQHERETVILASHGYEIEILQSTRALALEKIMKANAAAALRLGMSRGEADAFRARQVAYAEAPAPFEHRLRLQTLEKGLKDRPFVVIDERIEKDGGVLWFQD